MLVEERHQKILQLLEKNQSITVEELKKMIPVSVSTLRNDLRYLEETKKLKRSHGGAIRLPKTNEISYEHRAVLSNKEKEKIGIRAVSWINPNETILLDAGSTVMEAAKHLPTEFEFNVVTSALNTAIAAGEHPNVSVNLIGGVYRPSLQEVVGPKAVQEIQEITAHKVFLGASGLDLERGVTEHHVFSAEVKKAMISSAEQVILLLDSSKIGKSYFVKIASLQQIHVIITDSGISAENKKNLQNLGIEVVVV